jgi:hypothetical protein
VGERPVRPPRLVRARPPDALRRFWARLLPFCCRNTFGRDENNSSCR